MAKKRVTISFDEETLRHLDEDAAKLGVNRSVYASLLVELLHMGVSAKSMSEMPRESAVAELFASVLKTAGN